MLTISNLSKSFNGHSVFEKLTLEVKKGEFVVVSGANGTGKTTLTRILSGVILADGGEVAWKGRRVAPFSLARQEMSREIGVAFADEKTFYPHLSAEENIIFFENLYGKKRDGVFLEAIEILGAKDFMDKSFYSLSKGMKQKLCLLRALLGNPELLVVDELDALDEKSCSGADEMLKNYSIKIGAVLKFTSKKIDPGENLPDGAKLYTLQDGILKESATLI